MAQSACSKPSPAQTLSIILDLLTSKLIGFCTARDLSTTPGIGPVDPVFDDPHRPSPFEVAAPCTSIRTIWIGHASTYTLFPTSDPLRSFGVLTDPIFSKSCSPVGWPRRRVAVPFGVEGLGPVDAVIISHNHYDHLDKPSIRAIEALGRDTKFFVPLGTGRWFVKLGIPLRRIFELDWWESVSLAETEGGFVVCDDCPAGSSREKMGSKGKPAYFGSAGRPADKEGDPARRLSGSLHVQVVDEDNPKEASDFKNADIAECEEKLVTVASKPQELRMDDLPALKAVFKITCTPAQHPTGRSFLFFDKNATKSATWVVEQSPCRGVSGGFPQREGARMFFGGDTGFRSSDVSPVAEFVQEICDRFGPFNLVFVPAAPGSLSSRFGVSDRLVRHIHAIPADAVDMSLILTGSTQSGQNGNPAEVSAQAEKAITITMHHTTFDSRKGAQETMKDLAEARAGRGGLSGKWEDGGIVALQPGRWCDMAEL